MIRPLLALALLLTASPTLAGPLPPALEDYARNCAGILDALPIVRRETVAAIGPGTRVVLHKVCGGVPMTTYGNAGGLTHTIAGNRVLTEALAAWGWRADDVVGIEIGGARVDLYVHRD